MVLLRVELQELLHADVGESEGVGAVLLVGGGVDLRQQGATMRPDGDGRLWLQAVGSTPGEKWREIEGKQGKTHPDSFHHEADVADSHEVGALVDGVDGLDVAGDLRGRHAD